MKQHLDIAHQGTLGAEGRTAMTFDENSITHLMSILTDLYSNTTLAVVREYSTNARDAHIAAGNPERPIEITLPNGMTNMFIVQDFGTGMSKDDIVDHFSKYGWSSKRDSDDEVGTLGVGCKSGLTYTSQFTLVTTQDGITNTVLVTREESGGGVVQIIDTVSTTEPNGTSVQIPVKDWIDIGVVARDFFQYWDPGTVLIDGEAPACIWDTKVGNVRIDDDIVLQPHERDRFGSRVQLKQPSMIVMGNVAYPIDNYKLPYNLQDVDYMRAIIRVPIGVVNFVPSREALNYNKRTIETITDAWDFIYHQLAGNVQQSINDSLNAKEAYAIWKEWKNVLNKKAVQLHYQHTPFVGHLKIPEPGRTLIMDLQHHWGSADRSTRASETMDIDKIYKCVLHVVGHQGTAIAASTKAKIRQYCYDKGLTHGEVLVYPRVFGAPWISNDTCKRVRFDVIQAVKLPVDPDKPTRERQRSKYRVLNKGDNLDYLDELPDTVECWVPAAFTGVKRIDMVNFTGRGKIAVVLAADEKRFLRDHPTIITWEAHTLAQIEAVPLSGSDWVNFHWHQTNHYFDGQYNDPKTKLPQIFTHGSDKYTDKIIDPVLRSLLIGYWDSSGDAQDFRDRMYAVANIKNSFNVKLNSVSKSTKGPEIDAIRAWYEGVLDLAIGYNDRAAVITSLNAFYIVKNSLHVIPVL